MALAVGDMIQSSMERTHSLFSDSNPFIPQLCEEAESLKLALKSSYYKQASRPLAAVATAEKVVRPLLLTNGESSGSKPANGPSHQPKETKEDRLIALNSNNSSSSAQKPGPTSNALTIRHAKTVPTPQWHAPWELSTVISGHLGWVRSIAFDASNEWFATGSADRTIKIWDLAKCCAGAEGGLKLTLTGHINAVRGLAVSQRHPYLFSCSEDKKVFCWDLEYNKIIRHYHGHLSAVFCCTIHPTLDLLFTGGRDSVTRVWDIRTKQQIHVLGGHSGAVSSLIANPVDPQVISASHDSTVKLWDLAAGKSMSTLTQHKKAVRAIAGSNKEFTFASASADNVKKWQCRDGKFLRNMTPTNCVQNCAAINDDGVLVCGGDNGSLNFWDYETGYRFQSTDTIVQPGSLDAEAGIFAMAFDLSGSRLITCEADKSIKIWRENASASDETHPIDTRGWSKQCLALKPY